MKCYNTHTYARLGFDLILKELANNCLGAEAREQVLEMKPSWLAGVLLPELQKVNEYREILLFDDPFPLSELPGVEPLLKKARVEGNWLSTRELYTLMQWLVSVKDVRLYLRSRKEKYPGLYELAYALDFEYSLIHDLERVFDRRGNLKDDASPELGRIRRQMKKSAGDLRKTLNKILRKAVDHRWSEASEVTIRNDRLVIPVKADAKGRIPGFVQDVSSSGNTVFVEPAECLGLNNELRELQIGEHNEIVRILQGLTSRVRPYLEDLSGFHGTMIHLDILRAKARMAVDMKALLPVVNPEGQTTYLKEAYNPLLLLRAKVEKMEVVPLELTLNAEQHILVISGPNAGGKSVSLKTVGLLQLMLQCGMLIPVDGRSELRLFDSLFLDIGDEQSVESDLSTYTSHLYQMRLMGDNMTDKSLFLIDEFGSGTDPKLGGAMAEAFLERFVRQKAFGIITTHYGNIKDYAAITDSISNAAMEFDTEGLKPTYRLVEGLPGRSYAFEIAKRVGVHYLILRNARRKLGKKQLNTDQLLSQLEGKNQELANLVEENKVKEMRLKALVEQNEELQEALHKNKKQIIRDAQVEAKQLIKEANRRIENTIREIKEKQADKEVTKKLRRALEESSPEVEAAGEVAPPIPGKKKKQQKPLVPRIKILENEVPVAGDHVKLKSSDSLGRLVEVQGKRAVVEVGEMRLTVKLNQLQKVAAPKTQKTKPVSTQYSRPLSKVRIELDVLGMRVEEALPQVEKFIDEALLGNLGSVQILHGKGSGALREGIRNYLRDLNSVVSMKDAPLESGGAGWTVVELKA